MKLKYHIIIGIVFLTAGCEKILDLEPLDTISDAVVWNDETLINGYLATIYHGTQLAQIYGNFMGAVGSAGGEIRAYGTHYQQYKFATEVITSAGLYSAIDYWYYSNIRLCNEFIEHMQESSTIDQAIADQRIAEVRFLRAWMYFQMVVRYGGVPIITEPAKIDDSSEKIYPARNSEKEVYDFIISETEELTSILPSEYPAEDKGRPSKWAAYALQSRAALYAASIAKYGEIQLDGLLGFPASDVEQYATICYNASRAVMNNGIHTLYEEYTDPAENFQNLFLDESDANKEVIMAEVFDYSLDRTHWWSIRCMPHDFSATWAAWHYLYDFVERFEFEDGSPGTSISREQLEAQEWTPEELWGNRDPRFRATVFYPESPWQGGKVLFHSATIRDGVTYTSGTAEDGWPYAAAARNAARSGFMLRKGVDESMIMPANVRTDETNVIIFRLGEIYLNLIEAAYYLGNQSEALGVLNDLRKRAGMPEKTTISEDIIHNERFVELSLESHSYWDMRRWRIAKQLLDGVRMKGLQYVYNYDTKKYQITVINGEGVARTFNDHNYYLPITVERVAENPNFIENPEY